MRLFTRLALFASLFFLLSTSTFATTITISAAQIPNIQAGAGTYELRIWLDRTMVDSAGVTWPGGAIDSPSNFKRVSCTLASTTVTCNTFTLASTIDAQEGAQARYTAKLYRNNAPLLIYNKPFALPASLGASVTWEQIWRYNNTVPNRVLDNEYYTKNQVNALYTGSIFANPATTTSRGVGKSSMNVADPIFVETTDPRLGVESSSYSSLCDAVTAIGSTPETLDITTALASGSSCTVPSTLTLNFFNGGTVVLGSGHTIAVSSDTSGWPIATIFSGTGTVTLAGASTVHPEWWGAKANDSTDSASAFNKACAASLNGNSDKTIRLAAGVYVIGSAVTCGTASRTIGLSIRGSGKYATRLRWTGNTSDTVLKLWNIQYPLVENMGILGTTVPGIGLWFAVDNGNSGSGPRTNNVYISNASIGMLIGGGAEVSSGQANSGQHDTLSLDSCVTGVKITGANTEVQLFHNLTMGGSLMTRGFHVINGRGLYVKGADISLNILSNHIPFFVEVEGAGLAHGGGYNFEDMRMESMSGFFYAHPTNPALPLTLTIRNVSAASEPTGTTPPHDIIKLDAGSWTVAIRDSIFLAAQSRFSYLNTNADRYVSLLLENCMINNGWSSPDSTTDPNDDPRVLFNVTSSGTSPGADGGLRAIMRNNLLTVTTGVFQPRIRLKDRTILIHEANATAGTYQILNEQDNAGFAAAQLKGGGAVTTIAAGAGAGTTPTIAVSGNSVSGTVTLTTGTTPTASATVFTVTFPAAFASAPKVVLTPVGANSAALSGAASVYVDQAAGSTTTFVVKVLGTNLTAATAYTWNYHVIQ